MMENTNIQSRNKKTLIIILIILLLICLLSVMFFFFISLNRKNSIIINDDKLEIVSIENKIYNIYNKIDYLEGKIISNKKLKEVNVVIKSGNYEIVNQKLDNNKNWKIEKFGLISGSNDICFNVLLENNEKINECFIINNYNNENNGLVNSKDDDEDGLKNYEEIIFSTDTQKSDTDEDGLTDYQEIYYTFTNPLEKDSDGDGISDSEQDLDEDGLTNKLEAENKTNSLNSDTDSDGINDNDEINIYKTNPNNNDTDEDGFSDYDEINNLKTNPLEKNDTIDITYSSEDNKVSVKFDKADSDIYNSITITKNNNLNFGEDMVGYIMDAYDFYTDKKEIEAEIIFDLSDIDITDKNPTIYYFNEETQFLEELETSIIDGKATTKVNHFSTYVLIDKTSHDTILSENSEELIESSYTDLDVVFVIDISMSMDENDPNDSRKQIMSNFISSLKENDRAGVVLFKKSASVIKGGFAKSSSEKKVLITDVFNISNDNGHNSDSGTNGSIGLYTAINMFNDNNDAKRYIIFLTDGADTEVSYSYDEIYKMAKNKNITILSIGLGSNVDADSLRDIASNTNGKYYYAEKADELYNNYSGILSETTDYRTDSNSDGISDYVTKAICNGELKTSSGINPFEGISYEEIQKNADYDKDGLINGDEVEVAILDDKIYIKYLSDPLKKDTDGDGVSDKEDASPQKKFDEKFSVVNNINHKPSTPIEDDLEKQSNNAYNTEKGDYGSSKSRAETMINMFGSMPAAKALEHFLGNTGKKLNFNNDKGLLNTYRGKENFAKNTNSLIAVIEETVKNGKNLTFASNVELTGTDFSTHLDDLADLGWWYAVGSTRATMVGTAKNNNGIYEMTLKYNILDFYDWKKEGTIMNGGFGGLVSDAEMYKLHALGVAKQYRIEMNYTIKISWKKGDRYYLNKLKLWDTPSTMKVSI